MPDVLGSPSELRLWEDSAYTNIERHVGVLRCVVLKPALVCAVHGVRFGEVDVIQFGH